MSEKPLLYKSLSWIDVVEPTKHKVEELAKQYFFHELDVEDIIAGEQRAKIDDYDKYLFIVLHFPYVDKKSGMVKSEAVNIFLSGSYLITLHDGNLVKLKNLFQKAGEDMTLRKELMGNGSGFLLYEILDKLFDEQYPMIDKIERRIHSLEKDVFNLEKGQRDMLKDILQLKKDLITLERIMGPMRTVIPQLEYKNDKFIPEGLEIYFDDVVDKVEKIWSMIVNQKEVVQLLQDTNESVISHTTNNIIKILTFFSVVMLPLTLITGFFGMNVVFPPSVAVNPIAYIVICVTMVIVTIAMMIFFKFKKWI